MALNWGRAAGETLQMGVDAAPPEAYLWGRGRPNNPRSRSPVRSPARLRGLCPRRTVGGPPRRVRRHPPAPPAPGLRAGLEDPRLALRAAARARVADPDPETHPRVG